MTTATGQHELALVSPQDFTDRMQTHWTVTLGMPAPPALVSAWTIMAEQFVKSAINNARGQSDNPSVILPLPTGSGKTEGTCIYATMQAERNACATTEPVGVIIVTRLIEDADGLARKINDIAGRVVAVAQHSQSKVTPSDIFSADVLVITHKAFTNAAESYGAQDFERWDRLSRWRGGNRCLMIIDEALANVVQNYRATATNLGTVLSGVPSEMHSRFPAAIRMLDRLKMYLEKQAQQEGTEDHARILWDEGSADAVKEIKLLREALLATNFDATLFRDDASDVLDGILQDVEALLARHAYLYKSGIQHSIHSSTYLIPPGLPCAVIVDATAPYDMMYLLLGNRAYIAPLPGGMRDYSNVTLHVARTSSGLGKHTMDEKKQHRLNRLADELAERVPGREIFLCVHKHSEALAQTFNAGALCNLHVGHWGAVDGKNCWKDCDVAVIWGLPYMAEHHAINQLFAVHGPQDTKWLKTNVNKQHPTLLSVIMQRHLSTSVVQAINRICCRRVIDDVGRCAPCDIYIALPKSWQGDAILHDIEHSMPGIKVGHWDYEPDGPKVYAPRNHSANDAIISFMTGREPGPAPLSLIKRELQLTPRQIGRIREELRKFTSNLATALRKVGVSYLCTGRGRGSKSYLVKAA
ncbi:hypothetical protein ACVWXO_001265 [Bradyrhizobium sp. LM2.7]